MRTFLVTTLFLSGCASSGGRNLESPLTSDADLIGKTLGEAIEILRVRLDELPIVDEPPCLARALTGLTPDNQRVWLYFHRGDEAFNRSRNWSLEVLKRHRVAGIARRLNGNPWQVTGEVIWYYHSR
ncbi:MAG TPA: hypothetical protein VK661_07175 [Planctomycetota bacterium]|nr:hypothetical protein [Planctomycetota bacterium]